MAFVLCLVPQKRPKWTPKSSPNRPKIDPKRSPKPLKTLLGPLLEPTSVLAPFFHRFFIDFRLHSGALFGGNLGAMRHLIFSDFLETFPEASQEPLERFREPFGPHFGSILGSFFDAPCHLVEVRFCCYLLHLRHFEPPQERLKGHFFQDPF